MEAVESPIPITVHLSVNESGSWTAKVYDNLPHKGPLYTASGFDKARCEQLVDDWLAIHWPMVKR